MIQRRFGNVVFSHCGPELQNAEIDELESICGCQLPQDYRNFLLKVNGGHPHPSGLTIRSRPAEPPTLEEQRFIESQYLAAGQTDEQSATVKEFLMNVYIPPRVELFLGVGTKHNSVTLFANAIAASYSTPIPQIPIAHTTCGESIFLQLQAPYLGMAIYGGLLPEERSEWGRLVAENCVGKDFMEFLGSLITSKIALRPGYNPPKFIEELL